MRSAGRRRFVLLAPAAATAPGFSLKDLAGTGGRMDVVARVVPAALLVSHGLRESVDVYALLLGPPAAPKVVRFRSSAVRHLNPDERTTATLLEKAVGAPTTGPVWASSTPGVDVAVMGLEELLDGLPREGLFVLHEEGEDVAKLRVPEDATFVVGGPQGFTPEEEALLLERGARRVSVGPVSLQADQCVVVLHNHLDRSASSLGD